MKILRIKLAHYRGVEQSEVEFNQDGLTIIEGPNEIGKTSIAESIGILFDYQDSSKNKIVEAIKPVHTDIGAEIELEAISGKYHFIYFKRFNKKHESKLQIISPSPDNFTGREAHEKAIQILQDTIDVNLWKALRIQQGDATKLVDLSNQTSLTAALDVAAGGGEIDYREESVFELAQTEFSKYFTEKGSHKKPVKDAHSKQDELSTEVESLNNKIQGMEKDILKSSELVNEILLAKDKENELKLDREKYSKLLEEINKLESDVEKTKLKQESAQKSTDDAERNLSERQKLITDVAKAKQSAEKFAEKCKGAQTSIQTYADKFKKDEKDSARAEKLYKNAEDMFSLRRSDVDYFNELLHLEQLSERKIRIDNSREIIIKAQESITSNFVNKIMLEKIQKADMSLAKTEARLQADSPNMLIKGLNKINVLVDGKKVSINKGDEKTISVSDQTQLIIPDTLEVTLLAGSDSSDSIKKFEVAKNTLADIFKKAGVKSLKEARKAYDNRRDAELSLQSQQDIEKAALRDLSYDELVSKISRLSNSVPAFKKKRKSLPKISINLDDAKQQLNEATQEFESTKSFWDSAKNLSNESLSFYEAKKSLQRDDNIKYELAIKTHNDIEDTLSLARAKIADDKLSEIALDLKELFQTASAVFYSSSESLEKKDPEKIKELSDTTSGSLHTLSNRIENLQKESSEVVGRLKALGEEGLQEKLNLKRSELDHIQRENQSMNRRAEASKLLYQTLKQMREEARRAYVAPLKEKIESLGRIVFNNTFQVELTEDLSVNRRTLDGTTVSYESLSGGTKEQISLISRLACAIIVSNNGGAPLILDDELGYTDNDRLKLMGAVLAKTGKECQVIILTCIPDRYSNIGEAKVVRLS